MEKARHLSLISREQWLDPVQRNADSRLFHRVFIAAPLAFITRFQQPVRPDAAAGGPDRAVSGRVTRNRPLHSD
jgi:hypothetical protein